MLSINKLLMMLRPGLLLVSLACLCVTSVAQTETPSSRASFPIPEYKKVGTGQQTLLLIPCMSCRWNVWEEFMERNKSKYTMYSVTIPGFGGTPVPKLARGTDATPWTNNAIAALSQFIDDHKLKDLTVVGHSWGSLISVQLASKRPDSVKRVIAVDGQVENTTWAPAGQEERLAQARKIVEVWEKKFEDAEEWRQFNGVRGSIPFKDSVPIDVVGQFLKLHGSFMATPKEVVLEYWRENVLVDVTGATKSLRVPILQIMCLRGDDQEGQRTKHLEAMKRAGVLAQVRTIFFRDTTHFVMFHRPQQLDEAVSRFMLGEEAVDFVPSAARD
jgi:pimeloyl-ACP methyl ester carboxylesterase